MFTAVWTWHKDTATLQFFFPTSAIAGAAGVTAGVTAGVGAAGGVATGAAAVGGLGKHPGLKKKT